VTVIDSHCHLDSEEFEGDREEVIERALAAGVEQMVAIGTGDGPPDLEAGVCLAEKHPAILATVGVHPHDAAKADDNVFMRLRDLLRHPKVIALGEIGLDNHYDFAPRDRQRAVFIEQMQIAREASKPIVIHTREAWDDTFALLEEHWRPAGLPGILHCFSGSPGDAQRALALGLYLSFGGLVTFPKAIGVQTAAIEAPLERLLVETDAPYLAPVPHRGRRNEPAFVVETTRKLAALRGDSFERIAAATVNNFRRLCLPAVGSNS